LAHLKDWIANDPAIAASTKSQIESFVLSDTDLGAAGDLANGTKHFELSRKIYVGARIKKRELKVHASLDRTARSESRCFP